MTFLTRAEKSRSKESIFVPFPLPNGMEYLPYQVAGIEWMLSNPLDSMLIGDDMGLGKSLQAIGFANERRIKDILIICPSVVINNWENELRKFHSKQDLIIQKIHHKVDIWSKKADVIIVSYNLFDPEKCFNKKLLIVDEAHYLRTGKSKRTKAILGKKTLIHFRYKLFLTGTPILNRPVELYTLIKAINHVAINNCDKHTYGLRFCGARLDSFGRWDYSGHSNLDRLNEILRDSIMLRREKEDVLTQLPDKRINIIQFDMDSTVAHLDAQIQPFKEEIVKRSHHGAGLDGVAVKRREIAEKKILPVVEYLRMVLENVDKLVVFAYHRSVIAAIREHLKEFGVSIVIGGMSADDKTKNVNSFVQGNNRILLGNIQAAGVGINLVNASRVVFAEADWVAGNNNQAIDRCYRIGQKNFVQVDFLVYKNSIDEYILKANFKKQKISEQVNK